MNIVLLKSASFIIIIMIGYFLKSTNIIKNKDTLLLSKIVMTITLPATILVSVKSIQLNYVSLLIIILGIIPSVVLGFVAKNIFKNHTINERSIAMNTSSCYSIGNVTIPYVSALFPMMGMQYVSMFDIGNAITLFGIMPLMSNNSLIRSKFRITNFIKVLFSSIPFVTYCFIILLNIVNIQLHESIIQLIQPIASANTFLIMLMIGSTLNLRITRNLISSSIKILTIRIVGLILFSILIYYLLPIPEFAKSIVILCLASPIATVSVIYSYQIDHNSPLPSFVASVSILVGIALSTIVVMALF